MENNNIFLADTRVYIAGILMPAISVSITTTVGQPPTATITLPASALLFKIGRADRVPVHVFQRETYVESPQFVLLFEGFIDSKSYLNLASQRNININAIGLLDILNDAQVRFLREFTDIYSTAISGNAQKQLYYTECGRPFPAFLFVQGLSQQANADLIKFPSEYLDNLYRYLQGAGNKESTAGPNNGSVLSDYFVKQAEMIRLIRRYVPLPYFDEESDVWPKQDDTACVFPLISGMQKASAIELLVKAVTENVQQQSIQELLDFLANEMEYEFTQFSSPAFRPAVLDADGNEIEPARLVATCLKPLLNDAVPPLCNVIFRSQMHQISIHETYKGSPTRIQIYDVSNPANELAGTSVDAQVAKYSLITCYPSGKEAEDLPPYIQKVAAEILQSEKYTGPWVSEVQTPKWYHYLGLDYSGEEQALFKRIFCHRQLLSKKYFPRRLSASMTFNPYVTPGFPGVVFDAEDTGMAFAGYVLSVEHTITPADMTTLVEMNYVRLLDEASEIAIVHPLPAVQNITHDPKKMTHIYNALMGVPPSEEVPAVSGANAASFLDLYMRYHVKTPEILTPQRNPKEAYKKQRRNICTFDDYLAFMGLTVSSTGNGPEGPATPLELDGEFLSDRAPVPIYKVKQILSEKEQKDAENARESTGASDTTQESPTVTERQETLPENREAVLEQTSVNVRDILRTVAQREFAKRAYI